MVEGVAGESAAPGYFAYDAEPNHKDRARYGSSAPARRRSPSSPGCGPPARSWWTHATRRSARPGTCAAR
ncbi:hypothetical protein STANM309S_02855 [Streptomyces tanashiensis]|uniref:hypothetical protein n=1 Tax=Streptomyces tanashiensis TaxID=67367 RepID=UPI0034030B6D